MFNKFVDQLKIRLQKPLPGLPAQLLMAPLARKRFEKIDPEKYNPVKSAVLILLFPVGDNVHTLLIQRPVYEGVHSGQVAFPGGKFEEIDIDLKQTAIRETFEEVGVPAKDVEIIGKLTDLFIKVSNFIVSPYIGYVNKQPDFIIDAYEVQKIIPVGLFSLNDSGIKSIKTVSRNNGYKIRTPYYDIDGLTVWGATAMMISELNVVVEETKLISL